MKFALNKFGMISKKNKIAAEIICDVKNLKNSEL